MKKIYIIIVSFVLLASFAAIKSMSEPKTNKVPTIQDAKNKIEDKAAVSDIDNKIRAVYIDGRLPFNISMIKELKVNTIVLSQEGVRMPAAPYKTNYRALKSLEKNTKELEKSEIDYIIDINSGPGFSSDGKISSIFANDTEALYFAKMSCEVIKRHVSNKNFKGIMISLENTNVLEDNYYNTLKYIINKIQNSYPDVNIILNLYPCSFENNFENLSVPELKNVTLNAVIYFKGMSYPMYATGYKASLKINKNVILSNLQILKEFQEKNKTNMMITIKTPWTEKSDIFLQDVYEINKMLSFNLNIGYINSFDDYDFTKNEDVLKVIKRNNK
ncbi:hypothetical protein SAMN05443428_101214 [Caloramator quimbayensis]|uniref:Uncharacterized protein n=1 Tax=Caloramator quimbayensis TaxID=1147123 RepID=A0A1T4WGX9_9CLOT|nr:hypothetical protein [Caloramator quimbayensis]SKA76550.1 hypothetical protein SAMN05443428_101214 [Caloramator quimbayensis]